MTAVAIAYTIQDSNNNGISGGLANAYIKGTTTRQTVYADSDLTVPASNPVVANSDGQLLFYLDAANDYFLDFRDASDASIRLQLNYTNGEPEPLTFVAGPVNALNGLSAAITDISDEVKIVAANDLDISTNADNIVPINTVADAIADGSLGEVAAGLDVKTTHVSNIAALRALIPSTIDTAICLGRTVAGDGGLGFFRFDASDLSTEVTSDPLSGIYIAPNSDLTGASGAWVRIHDYEALGADPRWWGAKLDFDFNSNTGTDDLPFFEAAFAVVNWVHMPEGNTLFSDMLQLPTGSKLTGSGRTVSVIHASESHATAAFNMNALGVVRLGTAEPGATIEGIGFDFRHALGNAEDDRANVANFPPAIICAGIPRCRIDDIRISRAWDGIDATGNVGGLHLGLIECGALNIGLAIDGALDFVKLETLHAWPFGMSASVGLGLVYRDDVTIGISLGRCDNFSADTIQLFRCKFVRTGGTGFTSIAAQIANLALDGNSSGFIADSHTTQIGNYYSTKDGPATRTIEVSGGLHTIKDAKIQLNTLDDINVTGGQLNIMGGHLRQLSVGQSIGTVSAGRLEIHGCYLDVPDSARTVGYFVQSGTGELAVMNCTAAPSSAGGPLVDIGIDVAGNCISGNDFGGWSLELPSSIQNGCYGPNNVAPITFTPTVQFSTVGDSSIAYGLQNGEARIAADGIHVMVQLQFNTNAYTTAAGNLRIFLPLIGDFKGFDVMPIGPAYTEKVIFDSGYTQTQAVLRPASNEVQILQSGSNVNGNIIDPVNMPASTSNIRIFFSGFIPTR